MVGGAGDFFLSGARTDRAMAEAESRGAGEHAGRDGAADCAGADCAGLYGAGGHRRDSAAAKRADGSGEGIAFARAGLDPAPASACVAVHGLFVTAAAVPGINRVVSGIAIGGAGGKYVLLFFWF